MLRDLRGRPPWLVRVDDGGMVFGAGLLIDPDVVVTCAHVVASTLGADPGMPERPTGTLALTLPHTKEQATGTVEVWVPVEPDGSGDVAVIRLDRSVEATPAPLTASARLADHRYAVQGFPRGRRDSAEATGRLGGVVGPHWVQMTADGTTGFAIDRGFSGAPVWDDDAGAVVGLVVARENDAALRVGHMIPIAEIARLWPGIAKWVGFRLDLDESFDSHWLMRAKGVDPYDSVDAWHFTGRKRALTELADWLNGPSTDRKVRVVTGSPGSGKSAVLARTVLLADRIGRRLVPPDALPSGIPLPAVGSIDVAVHARGRTVEDVVRLIAAAAGVDANDQIELAQQLHRRGQPFTVALDALDEAAADDAVRIAAMLKRLAADPGRHGFRVLVGTRLGARGAATGALLGRLGNAVVIDLDCTEPDPRTGLSYLEFADIERYVEQRLAGVGPPGIATAIATHADGNFLIAQVASRAALAAADNGDESWGDTLPTTLADAVDDYFDVRFGDDAGKVRDLLTPLAFAEHPGFTEGPLWVAAAEALNSVHRSRVDLAEVIASAGSYLVEQTTTDPPSYRLFHQALEETLRLQYAERFPGRNGQRLVYEALLGQVPRDPAGSLRWERAEDYLCLNMAVHASAASRLDDLVQDVGFLVVAAPERLMPHLSDVLTEPARQGKFVYEKAKYQFSGQGREQRAASLALVARKTGFPAIADQAEARFAVPWSARPIAWNPEGDEQVVTRLLDMNPALWMDPTGSPAALSAESGRVGLYRTHEYQLQLDGWWDENDDEDPMFFLRHAVEILDDGQETVVSVASRHAGPVLQKWSLVGGPRPLGELRLPDGQPTATNTDVDLVRTPDGRLLALARTDDLLYLVDVDSDLPRLLHTVHCRPNSGGFCGGATIGVQDGVVFVAWFEPDDPATVATDLPHDESADADDDDFDLPPKARPRVSLATLVDDRLIGCGPPLTVHEFNPCAVRFLSGPNGGLLLFSSSGSGSALSEVTPNGLTATRSVPGSMIMCATGSGFPSGRSVAAFGDILGYVWLWEVGETLAPLGSPRRSHEGGIETLAMGMDAAGRPVLLSHRSFSSMLLWNVDNEPPEPPEPPLPLGDFAPTVALLAEGDAVLAAAIGATGTPELLIVTDQALLVHTHHSFDRDTGEEMEDDDDLPYSGMFDDIAIAYSGETDMLVAALGIDEIRMWRLTQEQCLIVVDEPLPFTGEAIALEEDAAGVPHIALGGDEGTVAWWTVGERGLERLAHHPPPDFIVALEHEVRRLEFVASADGTLRMFGVRGRTATIWGLPGEDDPSPRGGPQLVTGDTIEGVDQVAVASAGHAPVVLAYHKAGQGQLILYTARRDRFEAISEPWPANLNIRPQLAVLVRPDGRILCAAADVSGTVTVWRHHPTGTTVRVASADLGSAAAKLCWTVSGALVVWCQAGVVRLTGGW
jgi:hypothetical protein